MPCFGIYTLQEISSYLWINGTLTFKAFAFAYTTEILEEKNEVSDRISKSITQPNP